MTMDRCSLPSAIVPARASAARSVAAAASARPPVAAGGPAGLAAPLASRPAPLHPHARRPGPARPVRDASARQPNGGVAAPAPGVCAGNSGWKCRCYAATDRPDNRNTRKGAKPAWARPFGPAVVGLGFNGGTGACWLAGTACQQTAACCTTIQHCLSPCLQPLLTHARRNIHVCTQARVHMRLRIVRQCARTSCCCVPCSNHRRAQPLAAASAVAATGCSSSRGNSRSTAEALVPTVAAATAAGTMQQQRQRQWRGHAWPQQATQYAACCMCACPARRKLLGALQHSQAPASRANDCCDAPLRWMVVGEQRTAARRDCSSARRAGAPPPLLALLVQLSAPGAAVLAAGERSGGDGAVDACPPNRPHPLPPSKRCRLFILARSPRVSNCSAPALTRRCAP